MSSSVRGEGEDGMYLESNHIIEEDAEVSDTELVYSDDDAEEESNFDTNEEWNRDDNKDGRYRRDVFSKEGSSKLENYLMQYKEMRVDRVHLDLTVLDYLVKEGYLNAVETFLEE